MSLETSLRSALGRARGLGSAKEGAASHWMAERLPAIALVPLALWFVFVAVIPNLGASHAEIVAFMGSPFNATLMLLTVLCGFYHGMLGLIVILEDYIQAHTARNIAVFATKLYAALGAALAAVSILKLSVGG
ncbi:succinate dehydrogenase, hydrophobic membrane anchor protein [Pararhodospirillum oryzae]|uniref:Succinate dehydrogenase hydrophobic membrane anchor subunit n=1 Tax=Pararhodospirillum oryzae TaxID=478448 RepID=A0A512HAD5_9PROT|nr:succinate dehydrogenase, hydrophobic membrane anchor protein [Pararhodospirillum oryzae]GEO82388.1 succinate dehydrogenase, hydrophobic membrane anchor protein [Pararhodospirillum oryzae]